MSPSSLKLPSLSSWDLSNSARSPALYAPPDMNSEFHQLLESIIYLTKKLMFFRIFLHFYIHFISLNQGIVSGQYPLEECGGNIGGPLSQMSEAVNKIDNGSNQNNNTTVNGMGSSGNGLSSSNEMFSNNNKVYKQ